MDMQKILLDQSQHRPGTKSNMWISGKKIIVSCSNWNLLSTSHSPHQELLFQNTLTGEICYFSNNCWGNLLLFQIQDIIPKLNLFLVSSSTLHIQADERGFINTVMVAKPTVAIYMWLWHSEQISLDQSGGGWSLKKKKNIS